MTTMTERMPNGNRYRIVDNTAYHEETDPAVVAVLERFRASKQLLRVHLGDSETGRVWLEEHDIAGRIGRSTGTIKIPLMFPPRSIGGSGLLDQCIVAMQDTTCRWLWKHPKFVLPDLRIAYRKGTAHRGPYLVERFGHLPGGQPEIVASFAKQADRMLWVALMRGERFPSVREMRAMEDGD